MSQPALAQTNPMKALFQTILAELDAVKKSLESIVPPQSQLLASTVSSSLHSGGKYLRPAVTLLAGVATEACHPRHTPDNRQKLIEVAAVSEMIHIATLLHDDVIDESELRRGKKTIRAELGNKVSVLSGDYLLAQASLKLAQLGNTRLVSIYAQVLADLCDGEVIQMKGSYQLNAPDSDAWDSYYRKTYCKTASLFSAGCEAAGVVNGLPETQIEALKAYGKNFGIGFQIVDDLLDYTSSEAEMGKPVLDDLKNGLLNAPILIALYDNKLSEQQRSQFKSMMRAFFDTEDTDVSEQTRLIGDIQHHLKEIQALQKTRTLAENAINTACQSLDFAPDSTEKQSLIKLAQQVLERRS